MGDEFYQGLTSKLQCNFSIPFLNNIDCMKFIVSILLIALLSAAAGLFLPWYSIAPVALLVTALIPQQPFKSFLTGFIALFLLWGLLSAYISVSNNHLLAHKVALIIFKKDDPYLLLFATAFVGAIVAGFGALTGSYLRKVMV